MKSGESCRSSSMIIANSASGKAAKTCVKLHWIMWLILAADPVAVSEGASELLQNWGWNSCDGIIEKLEQINKYGFKTFR